MAKGSGGTPGMKHNQRGAAMDKARDNVYREASRTVLLRCKHEARGQPLARKADGTRLYICPEGCGLQQARPR